MAQAPRWTKTLLSRRIFPGLRGYLPGAAQGSSLWKVQLWAPQPGEFTVYCTHLHPGPILHWKAASPALVMPAEASGQKGRRSLGGLPWWFSGKESTCQCRGHRGHSWWKIPHATEQLSPCALLSLCSEPGSCSYWGPRALEPMLDE